MSKQLEQKIDSTKHPEPPHCITVKGARVHNLKDIDVSVPLNQFVGIAGVSGSGKSSLAMGVLYAEGSRRYLDALSTYTRRRISQSGRAEVDEVLHVPAALALRQRPGIPGVRSTFGTSTELLNHLRLAFSRLGSHQCPNGHHVPPSPNVALDLPLTCPVCGVSFMGPGAEAMAFNSEGACPRCGGTGVVREVDESKLVPDESLTIEEGAVASWRALMWSLMVDIAREMGVRTNVPFNQLTPKERDIVFHGPPEKKHIVYQNKDGRSGELDFTYYNAVYTVENSLAKVKDEKGLKRVSKFLTEQVCPECGGTRLSKKVRSTLLCDLNLAQATALTLDELAAWIPTIAPAMPDDMKAMATNILDDMREPMTRLQQLGLGYLSLDRASSTLSTGERQRVQLSRAVRNRTTGVLYVLDEPSIGLHPSNMDGLMGVVDDLLADGNSIVMVDHDVRVLRQADHLIELGPEAGAKGGRVIAQGTVEAVESSEDSTIGPFLSGKKQIRPRHRCAEKDLFAQGAITLKTDSIHTVKPLDVKIPRGRLTVVTGVSGSGKTTLVLESLIPALQAHIDNSALPRHVKSIEVEGPLRKAELIDSTPIGVNVRSTVATYSGVLDDLRRSFAQLAASKERGLKAGDFSYNTGSLRCPTCDGTGSISLDIQFLPDVDIECPDCHGSRYSADAYTIALPIRSAHTEKSADNNSSSEIAHLSNNHDIEHLITSDSILSPKNDHIPDNITESNGTPVSHSSLKMDSALGPNDISLPSSVPNPNGVLNPNSNSNQKENAFTAEQVRTMIESDVEHEGFDSLQALPLPEILALTVDEALECLADQKRVAAKLKILHSLGLGYLTLGEATPVLSGGEAQRLKLASEIGKSQNDALFVFDEPTIGLHPLDVEVLLNVLQGLLDHGATVVVIEHDLDMIANADYLIDLGPGGGEAGGRIVGTGTPEALAANPESITGRYLRF